MTASISVRHTPFDADSTAADVLNGVDLTSRRAIVTGAATGIGLETARALAAAGAEVTIAVRDADAGEAARAGIVESTGNDRVLVGEVDLADLTSVARFVRLWDGPLHMLVNNAGVMAGPSQPELRTRMGWELQFATNHMGHFALATGLHWALTAVDGARVVSVSSDAHRRAPVDFDDTHFLTRPYDRSAAYAQSRTANVLFAVEAARRWADDGIAVNAVNPGAIRTALLQHADSGRTAERAWKTPEQGAATSVLMAASPWVSGVTGRYFEDNNEAGRAGDEPHRGVAPHALDADDASRLWRLSECLLRDETWHRAA
jgi:NAD(P)-dependent dehydrogenase (short-subunit alcohol dehydrogenase family)